MPSDNYLKLKKMTHLIIRSTKVSFGRKLICENIGITPFQYAVLVATKDKTTTIKEIADWFGFKSPSIVPVVDKLENQGYLLRQTDQQDRRKTLLVITKKGRQLLEKISINHENDDLHQALNKMSPEKQNQLLNLIQELIDHLPQ